CTCKASAKVLREMLDKMRTKTKVNDPARVKLINELARVCYTTANAHNNVCYDHLQYLSSKMGLKTRTMRKEDLHDVLLSLYRTKGTWGAVQSHPVTSGLFLQPYRGARHLEDMKSFRYLPASVQVGVDWRGVRQALNVEAGYQAFLQTGNVVQDVFSWVFQDSELVKILDESYDMYLYHTRLIDGKSNLGWVRIMFHSLIQQLMRGDLMYYLLYASFREKTNLISYPYYTKYTKPGDATKFRHIDLNISEAVATGRGVDLIQGSVSWDDEDGQNCTEILEEFHRHIAEYQQWRKGRNIPDSTGKIEGWKDEEHWPAEIQNKLPNVQWKKIICKKGDVRITDPRLPHGSTGPATRRRRTMLPWLVLVHDDMTTMEIPEMGSYQEIAAAHQNLTAAPRTPSGHANMYGGIKWAFPGDVQPIYSSAISRAVNCQLPWNSPLVQHELDTYLVRPNPAKLRQWITDTRLDTTRMVKRHWEITKAMEKAAF
ncbi:hypothetical protein IQ06DRAFT_178379, partial [Phaeosphaeriaceae sp. SRC1lsM3a]